MMKQYEKFTQGKKELLNIADNTTSILTAINQTVLLESLDNLRERLNRDSFKVMILGEFKRGKSTFINSLLGEEILPAFATPCTAVINEIKYAEEKSAVLYFRENVKSDDVDIYSQEVQEHVKIHEAQSHIPRLIIDINDLEDYVTIPFDAEDERAALAESPYTHAEIYWPLELCKNGVELIDSPGLNEHSTRTAVTSNYLNKVDAVVFVMSGTAMASKSELDVIKKQVKPSGHDHLFFIINRFDEIREREQPRVMKHAHNKLSPLTDLGQEGIFFTSAYNALKGRLHQDQKLLEESGVPGFEMRLAEYLTNERFRIKMLRPLFELSATAYQAKSTIPILKSNLKEGLISLERKYQEIKPILIKTEADIENVISKIRRSRTSLRNAVHRTIAERQKHLYHTVLELGSNIEVETEFSLFGDREQMMKDITEEVVTALSQQIEQLQTTWNETHLSPLIEGGLSEIESTIDRDISIILEQVNKANALFNQSVNVDSDDASTLERVLAGAGGFLIGGFGSAFIGGTFGFKEMAKSILPQVGIIVGLSLVGLTNPFILIPALLTGGFIQGVLKGDKIKVKIRDKVVTKVAEDLRANSDQAGRDGAKKVYEKTEPLETEIQKKLNAEVQKIREKYESSKRTLNEGQAETDRKLNNLDQEQVKLDSLIQRIESAKLELIS
jgi:GTP-binding protein EngB required for normal cell division